MKAKTAICILLGLLLLVILFHLAIVLKFIPYDIAWGGRIEDESQMYALETVSIVINLFLVIILLMKGQHLKMRFNEKLTNGMLWLFLVLFALNTIGNLLAKTIFEKCFAILTLVFAIMIWFILKSKHVNEKDKSNSMK